jgi:hypothetical protein
MRGLSVLPDSAGATQRTGAGGAVAAALVGLEAREAFHDGGMTDHGMQYHETRFAAGHRGFRCGPEHNSAGC